MTGCRGSTRPNSADARSVQHFLNRLRAQLRIAYGVVMLLYLLFRYHAKWPEDAASLPTIEMPLR
jgi:hypothetical protein